MIDHDRLFKELISTFFVEFLELFIPETLNYLDRASITFLDKEVFTDITAGERYEADLIVKAKFRSQESFFLIHIENQAQQQTDFSKRMFRYFSRLYEKFDLPIYPVVLFSYKYPKTIEPNCHQVAFPNKVVLNFNYDVIQLNQLNWRDFVQQANPVASALMAKMNIADSDRPKVKLECLRLLATLRLNPAKMQLISGFIDSYLELNAQEKQLFQSEVDKIEPTQKEATMKIVTSWMRDGMQSEALSLVMRQLTRKIGTLTPELQQRIEQLQLAQLEDLAEELLDFSEVADLEAWLQRISIGK
ncbi:MAG: DUF4351 domain-containing protein [Tatlockia sp.]|nr:DUF4351 domain-containing protein [Tatlockia sp.]